MITLDMVMRAEQIVIRVNAICSMSKRCGKHLEFYVSEIKRARSEEEYLKIKRKVQRIRLLHDRLHDEAGELEKELDIMKEAST